MNNKGKTFLLVFFVLFFVGFIFFVNATLWDVSTADYNGVNISTTDAVGRDFVFTTDGSNAFELGASNKSIYHYSCSDSWNISSCSYGGTNLSFQDNNAGGMFFNSSGTGLYIIGGSNNLIFQYKCSSGYTLTTCSNSANLSTQDAQPTDVFFNATGTKLYEVGLDGDLIYQYTCSSPWDLSTCSYDNVNISTQSTSPQGMFFNSSGTGLFEIDAASDNIFQYTCSTPWDLSTCSYISISLPTQSDVSTGLFFKPDGTKLYESSVTTIYESDIYDDTSAPNIGLIEPFFNETVSSNTLNFVGVVEDDVAIRNVSLYIDGVSLQTNTTEYDTFTTRGTYTGTHFDLGGSGNGEALGIAFFEGFFWVTDFIDALVYKYFENGTYTGVTIDTSSIGSNVPVGIVAYENSLWITDDGNDAVYRWWSNGTYAGENFSLGGGNVDPAAISEYGGYFWIHDPTNDEVYKYWTNGTYTGTSFDTSSISNGQALLVYGGFLWIHDHSADITYKYWTNGTYTGESFSITGSHLVHGMTAYNNYFWLTDLGADEVWQYETGYVLYNFTQAIESGDHNWTLEAYDISNRMVTAPEWEFTVTAEDTIDPVISLFSPEDTTNSSSSSNNFSAIVSDNVIVDTVALYGNFSGSWAISQIDMSGTNNTFYNLTANISDGYYIWGYWANDTSGNEVFSSNRTLLVDANGPNIGLNSPYFYENFTSNTLNFVGVVEDNIAIKNVSLYIDGVLNQTNTTEYDTFTTRGTYTGTHFDLGGSGNGDALGITYYDGYFWVSDWVDNEIYKYFPNGTYTGTSFDTAGIGATVPVGMIGVDGYLWIDSDGTDEVYQFWINGTYTGEHFDTNAYGNTNTGMMIEYMGYWWIIDPAGDTVYQYFPNGTYTGFNFDTSEAGGADAFGLAVYGGFFWINNHGNDNTYKYWTNGTYTGESYSIEAAHFSHGFIAYNNYFWYTDLSSDEVWQYETGYVLYNFTSDLSSGDHNWTLEAYDTFGNLALSDTFEFSVNGEDVSDSCTYSSGNWEIDLSDSCVISVDTNVAGNITFTGTGIVTFNAIINASNLQYPSTNQRIFIDSNARINIG